jgi:2-keto-4-pentenoate hydratase/2-oxohepta-3-ene-1,7-dioic acid hydratase in catechol pathway
MQNLGAQERRALSCRTFLKPGDVVEVSNPQMGTLRNRIVAKS